MSLLGKKKGRSGQAIYCGSCGFSNSSSALKHYSFRGIGSLIGGAYILLKDAIIFELSKDSAWKNRSIGKKIMNLEVVGPGGQDMDIRLSAMRNWPLAIGQLVSFIISLVSYPWLALSSWSLLAAVTTVIGIIEIVLVITDPEGRRLGDRLADTRVRQIASEIPSEG